MHILILRTKLQAVIADKLIADNIISTPIHLILFSRKGEPELASYCIKIIHRAKKVTNILRPKNSFFYLFYIFLKSFWRAKKTNGTLYLASINWFSLALALKLFPGLSVSTFDDGLANLQKNSPYFSNSPSGHTSIQRLLSKVFFPNGPSFFMRNRTNHHYTIYPEVENIVSASKISLIHIDWRALINKDDHPSLPRNVSHILLGTVYKEARQIWPRMVSEKEIAKVQKWADLYIPHPRQIDTPCTHEVLGEYPAESIIAFYAESNAIIVAHFNSSAVIPFSDDPKITLVDLTRVGIEALNLH